jgi:hypothetical protein
MSVSLVTVLVVCPRGRPLAAATTLLVVRNWVLWSDRSFNMGDVEDKFTPVLCAALLTDFKLHCFS